MKKTIPQGLNNRCRVVGVSMAYGHNLVPVRALTLVLLAALAPAASAQTMAELKEMSPAECTDACVGKGLGGGTCPDLDTCTDQCRRFCSFTPVSETGSEETIVPLSPIPGVEVGNTILMRTKQPTWEYTGPSFEAGPIQQGRIDEISADTLILQTGKSRFLGTSFSNVDSLWVRQRGTGRGALYGALIGGTALGVFATVGAITQCGDSPGSDGCSYSTAAIPIATLTAAAVGGLVGALIGSMFKSWRLRYNSSHNLANLGVNADPPVAAGQIRLKF